MPQPTDSECVSRLSEILSAHQAALQQQLEAILQQRFHEIARQVGAELEAVRRHGRRPPAPGPLAALPIEEQRLHLAARRFARVQVAQMRLDHAEAVKRGRQQGNLYMQLRAAIDAAREKFQCDYVAICPSMRDYLHLEMVRVLAQDDATRLGSDYPGPLV